MLSTNDTKLSHWACSCFQNDSTPFYYNKTVRNKNIEEERERLFYHLCMCQTFFSVSLFSLVCWQMHIHGGAANETFLLTLSVSVKLDDGNGMDDVMRCEDRAQIWVYDY